MSTTHNPKRFVDALAQHVEEESLEFVKHCKGGPVPGVTEEISLEWRRLSKAPRPGALST